MTRNATIGCTVVVEAAPQHGCTDVHVVGDLDTDAMPAMNEAVARIVALVPERVVVDLAEVAFAGAALPNFLATLVNALPKGVPVTVCRPRPMSRWVLDTTGMAEIVTISPARLPRPVRR